MRNGTKEQEFLNLFDTHVDKLFSRCFGRIPDRVQTDKLIEKTFKRAWDQVAKSGHMRVNEFYRLLDELINERIDGRNLPFPAFFAYLSGRVKRYLYIVRVVMS